MKKHLIILLHFLLFAHFVFSNEKTKCIPLKDIESIQSIPNLDYIITKFQLDNDSCYYFKFTDSNEVSITKYYSSKIYQLQIEKHLTSNEIDLNFRKEKPFNEINISFFPQSNGLKIELWDSLTLDYFYMDVEGVTSLFCNMQECKHCEYCSYNKNGEITYKNNYIPSRCVDAIEKHHIKGDNLGYFQRNYNLLTDGYEIFFEKGIPVKKYLYKAGEFIEEN